MKFYFFIFLLCFFFIYCTPIAFNADKSRSYDSIIEYEYKDISSSDCVNNKDNCNKNKFIKDLKSKLNLITEYFTISSKESLEILLVIDTSPSMDENLEKLGENLESILSHIKNKNWRMAFITTDHGDHESSKNKNEKWEDYKGDMPKFGKFMFLEHAGTILDKFMLNKYIPSYKQIFTDTITRADSSDCELPPYCQEDNEQPLRSLKSAFSRYGADLQTQQFFKPHTDTIVLIITNEDERDTDPQNATTAQEVINTYNTVFDGQNKRLFGFTISIQDELCYLAEDHAKFMGLFNYSKGGIVNYGHSIGQLSTLTGGKNISICSPDYNKSLSNISLFTKHLVDSSIVLQKLFYIPKTLQISLSPIQPEISWKLYGRKVVFSKGIQPKTQVKVSYKYEEL